MPTADETMRAQRDAAIAAYQGGDLDAAHQVAKALVARPLDGGLLIADATLALERREAGALDGLITMLKQAPDWLDGHVALARLQWGAGDRRTFLATIERALHALPRHAGLWTRYMNLLAESGQPLRAAAVAADLRRTGGDVPALRLIEAQYAGAAGAHDRAATLLDDVPNAMPDRALSLARHLLRTGDVAASLPHLDAARADNPADVAAWALTELAWRATGNPRHRWLLDLDTMVRVVALDIDTLGLAELADDLRGQHAKRWPALGQSARCATQTRGNLRDSRLLSIKRLFEHLDVEIAAYLDALPPADAAHPLLKHRDAAPSVAAAWSIRINGGGNHVSHIHPGGILSSACHIASPESSDTARAGWLELGRPPADILLTLDPLAALASVAGQLVLFPSYLYHSTVASEAGERLSVAFDAV